MDIEMELRTPGASVGVPASGRENLLTVLFGLWMTVGLFLDGSFHQNLDGDTESFLTPWHAVFYAGFAASALWLTAMSRRRAPEGDWSLRFLPAGYGGARLGIVLFAVGGAGDAVWHTAFGVERGVDALLSPTHLVLFVGLLLILTAPWRAARTAAGPGSWLLVGSLTSATALVGFFLNFTWGLGIASLARVPYDPTTDAGETQLIAGVASMLVTTAVLFVAARMLLRAGALPPGSFTVLFGVVASLVSAAFDEDIEGVVAAVLAGVALDVLLRAVPSCRVDVRTVASAFGVASAGMWLVYLGLLAGLDGIDWQAEIWLGSVVLNGLAAYAIAVVLPPNNEPAPSPGAHP
jgi:hypothetical protein